MTNTIVCPNCKNPIEVTEVMSAQLAEKIRSELQEELTLKGKELEKHEKDLQKLQAETAQQQKNIESKIQERVEQQRKLLTEEAKKKAADELAVELQDRDARLKETKDRLEQTQKNELALREKVREVEQRQEELELEVARKLDEEREKIISATKKKTAHEYDMREAEKNKQIDDYSKQVTELKRKLEQGSQQTQGEVQELALEKLLSESFPADSIEPVPKGISGGDALQQVHDSNGAECGLILWESKRTKRWSDKWLTKLRDDQRQAKAALSVIVSTTMPDDVDTFLWRDDIWICSWSCVVGLATALRANLIGLSRKERTLEGRREKTDLVYRYLTSPEFRNRITGIAEAFITMGKELDQEKRAIQRLWAKREQQIKQVTANTVGIYGDLQGIIGASLPEIEGMRLPQLETGNMDSTNNSET